MTCSCCSSLPFHVWCMCKWEIYIYIYTPITIHILKAYDESYSKVIRGHKYKDKENDKDKNADKVPETPNICYILEILMTNSFQLWLYIPHPGQCGHPVHADHPGQPVILFRPCNQFYSCRAECITTSGFFSSFAWSSLVGLHGARVIWKGSEWMDITILRFCNQVCLCQVVESSRDRLNF